MGTMKVVDVYARWRLVQSPRPSTIEPMHIWPGKLIENPFVESFNGRLSEECLNVSRFRNLFDARGLSQQRRAVTFGLGLAQPTSLQSLARAEVSARLKSGAHTRIETASRCGPSDWRKERTLSRMDRRRPR
jgi:hypothetical protein